MECLVAHNVYFRAGKVVATAIEDESPVFSLIKNIILDSSKNVFLVVEQLQTINYCHHFRSYFVRHITNPHMFALSLSSLIDHHCITPHNFLNKLCISTKYSYS